MTILDEIVANKRGEVAMAKQFTSAKDLELLPNFTRRPISLAMSLARGSGIIAEIKRRSPSKGVMKADLSVEAVSAGYIRAGAVALSILTDLKYFGGSNKDLTAARRNACPILRKDFIVDEYQIIESKAIGADAILLIAAVLKTEEIKMFAAKAHSLGLEVLLEVHTAEELSRSLCEGITMVGVNNRNLKDMTVDLGHSFKIGPKIPSGITKVAESGISTGPAIQKLREAGFKGFLIGEAFLTQPDPAQACAKLVAEAA